MLTFGILLLVLLLPQFITTWVSFFNPHIAWLDAVIFTNFIVINVLYAFALAVVFGGLLR